MKYLFEIQEKLVPEMISLAEMRYTILKNVYYHQPVGRRTLAKRLELSERTVRNELEFLQEQGLINVSKSGASISSTGEDFLEELDTYIKEIKDIKDHNDPELSAEWHYLEDDDDMLEAGEDYSDITGLNFEFFSYE